MLINQLSQSLLFYFVFTVFSGIGLFLTLRVFPGNFKLAYFSAKVLGLAVFGYLIWLLSSLKILNYQNNVLIVVLFFVFAAGGLVYAFLKIFKNTLGEGRLSILNQILWLELISLVLYFGYLYLRSFSPAAYGTERFMDMALLNASSKANYFPFTDSWYAGKAVNYYYYGHYLISLLTKLSGLPVALTYNFAIGIIFSISAVLSGLLSHSICKSKVFASLAAFLVTTSGSLFYASCVIFTWIKGDTICSYASSTRLFTPSYIINEIPSYSFTVGDLHAHFLALPFFILNLCLIFALTKTEKPNKILSFALLIGAVTSALVNPSDLTTLALMLTVYWVYKVFILYKETGSFNSLIKSFQLKPWLYLAIFLILGSLALALPFLKNFTSPVLGFGFAPLYAFSHGFLFSGYQYPTPISAILGMWGIFLSVLAVFFVSFKTQWKNYMFMALSLFTAIFLILFVELFFVKDIYHIANPPYFRANTVFKYGYHTWTILSISFSAALAALMGRIKAQDVYKPLLKPLYFLLAAFVALGSFYPYQANKQFYPKVAPLTLDSSEFIKKESIDDYNIINWLNRNIKERPVVVEAVGDSYTYFGRISVFGGTITPMGWKSHEWTWRFEGHDAAKIKAKDPNANVETGYGAVSKVADDIREIYESPDLNFTKNLLSLYNADYIYVGNLERDTYNITSENKFYALGTLAYQSGNSKLFKIKK